MKKLALALVCFASVAFMASCVKPVEHPEPSLAVMTGENYVFDGQTIDLGQDYYIGFRAASNSETQKELKSFKISATYTKLATEESETRDTIINISGTEYVFRDTLNFNPDRNEIIGKMTINVTVTDVDEKVNSTSLTLNLNQTEEPLTEVDFEWYRLGNTQTGLEEYGLYWDQNAKAPFAQIKPLTGVILYKFESTVWDEVKYETQKAAKFADGATTAAMYNNVDVNLANGTYDDVIGTRMPDGTLHLIHVTSHRVGAQQASGRPIYINGQAK